MSAPQARDEQFVKYLKNVTSIPTETLLEDVRQGKCYATAVANLGRTPDHVAYRKKLLDGGLVFIILGLLGQCETKKFSELVVEEEGGKAVDSPATWVGILLNSVAHTSRPPSGSSAEVPGGDGDTICMEIAENIEPLVKCMRDDQTRELFHSI